jgi:hypothetical protein
MGRRRDGFPYVERALAVEAARREVDRTFRNVTRRHDEADPATAAWLEAIGLPYDELHCSYDKLARAQEIGIDVLVDDAPATLERAREHGIAGATIRHPWNAELCEREGYVCGADWPELAAAVEPLLRDGVVAKGIAPLYIEQEPL